MGDAWHRSPTSFSGEISLARLTSHDFPGDNRPSPFHLQLMAHILITAGPTREFLDPVRYLSNASTGRMAAALATALLESGQQVTIISGPVQISYPDQATVVAVTTTQEMLDRCLEHLPEADGVIAVAAPCDYRPKEIAAQKIKKIDDQPLVLTLQPTPDILAALTQAKPSAWYIGFALETENGIPHAIAKKKKKNCDWILLNQASAIGAKDTSIQIVDHLDQVSDAIQGSKTAVATEIVSRVCDHFIRKSS